MSMVEKVTEQLKQLGIKPQKNPQKEILGFKLTVCQLVVVVLSMISVTFLFVPLFYLQDIKFMVVFFILSLLFLILGIWFWLHQSEICENPEEFQE